MAEKWIAVPGIVQPGHQVASGRSRSSPYPQGTIEMQTPFFRALGLDLAAYFPGTLNVSIWPYRFVVQQPQYTFAQVKWSPEHEPESFSFCDCRITFQQLQVQGLIYYPHPETKLDHFQDPSTLEILAPPIPNIGYGDRVLIEFDPMTVLLQQSGE